MLLQKAMTRQSRRLLKNLFATIQVIVPAHTIVTAQDEGLITLALNKDFKARMVAGSVTGMAQDFIPQNMPPDASHLTIDDHAAAAEQADEQAESAAGKKLFGEEE